MDDTVYPYTPLQGTCNYDAENSTYMNTEEFAFLTYRDYANVKYALSKSPIIIYVHASCVEFMNYMSGILSDTLGNCTYTPDHVIQLIGYGTETNEAGVSTDYYIAKNSWDTTWGENGYIRMAVADEYQVKGTANIFEWKPLYARSLKQCINGACETVDEEHQIHIFENDNETDMYYEEIDDGDDYYDDEICYTDDACCEYMDCCDYDHCDGYGSESDSNSDSAGAANTMAFVMAGAAFTVLPLNMMLPDM